MYEKVTIFNVKRNPITRVDEYKRSVKMAHWESEQGIKLGDTNITTDSQIVVVFPMQNGFVLPSEYKSLSDVAGKWTLNNGDVIYRGEVASVSDVSDEKMVIASYEINTNSRVERLKNYTAYGK